MFGLYLFKQELQNLAVKHPNIHLITLGELEKMFFCFKVSFIACDRMLFTPRYSFLPFQMLSVKRA